ncbi:MAG: cell wall hydrolase [Pseudomonadota bacterium]
MFLTIMVHSAVAHSRADCDRMRQDELSCLACNIYHEARGESEAGRMMVGVVTANRVKSKRFPNSFCEVVWAPKQFSWTGDGKSDVVREQAMWKRSRAMAEHILSVYRRGGKVQVSGVAANATHYHNVSVRPRWAKHFAATAQLGRHIFYSN